MALYNANLAGGGSSVTIDDVVYEGDLKLKSTYNDTYLTDLPDTTYGASGTGNTAFVIDNELYVYTYDGNIYKYNDNNWVNVTDDGYSNCAFLFATSYEGAIHLLCGSKSGYERVHKKYINGTWSDDTALPYDLRYGVAVSDENDFYIAGGGGSTKSCYKYNGYWSSKGTIPYTLSEATACIKDGLFNILGTSLSGYENSHYVLNSNNTWTSVSTLPYSFRSGGCVVLDGKIHLFGHYSYNNNLGYYHYSLNSETNVWTKENDLPFPFRYGSYTKYNNSICLLGSDSRSYESNSSSAVQKLLFREKVVCLNKKNYEIVS